MHSLLVLEQSDRHFESIQVNPIDQQMRSEFSSPSIPVLLIIQHHVKQYNSMEYEKDHKSLWLTIYKVVDRVVLNNFSTRLSHDDYRIVLDSFVDLIALQLHHKMIDSIEDYPKREKKGSGEGYEQSN